MSFLSPRYDGPDTTLAFEEQGRGKQQVRGSSNESLKKSTSFVPRVRPYLICLILLSGIFISIIDIIRTWDGHYASKGE